MGPIPVVTVMDDEAIKAILTQVHEFRKPTFKALEGLLLNGIMMHEGAKWAKHRKIINPAFHIEKLKLVHEAACFSSEKLIGDWENLISAGQHGSREVDVFPPISDLTGDVISRTAFGSSYEEGRKIFLLQEEQIRLFFKNLKFAFIPGWRWVVY